MFLFTLPLKVILAPEFGARKAILWVYCIYFDDPSRSTNELKIDFRSPNSGHLQFGMDQAEIFRWIALCRRPPSSPGK